MQYTAMRMYCTCIDKPTNALLSVDSAGIHPSSHQTCKDELVQGIQLFWATVDVQKCRRYIGHLRRVLPHIVELNGDAIGF